MVRHFSQVMYAVAYQLVTKNAAPRMEISSAALIRKSFTERNEFYCLGAPPERGFCKFNS